MLLPHADFAAPVMVKTAAKTGLLGPYRLNFDAIGAAVTRDSAGVYALGYASSEGKFCINHVGRADSSVKSKLRDCIGSATLFKFLYLPTSKAAFERECELFHDFNASPVDRLSVFPQFA
jgi:hypothetical protein